METEFFSYGFVYSEPNAYGHEKSCKRSPCFRKRQQNLDDMHMWNENLNMELSVRKGNPQSYAGTSTNSSHKHGIYSLEIAILFAIAWKTHKNFSCEHGIL